MISSGFPIWINVWLLPLTGLAVAWLTAWYVFRRRWGQILPWLNIYVAFIAVSNLIVLGIYYSQPYAAEQAAFQSNVYFNAYYVSTGIAPLLVIAFLFTVLGHMLRERPDILHRARVIWACIFVVSGILAVVGLLLNREPSWNANLCRICNLSARGGAFVMGGLLLSLAIYKMKYSLPLESRVLLIACLLGGWYVLDFGIALYGNTPVINSVMIILGLAANVVLLFAVRTGPQEIATLSLARAER